MTSDLVTNVIATYLGASDADYAHGMTWYPSVNADIKRIGVDPWVGAGIFAAYSINTPWWRNYDMAMDTLRTGVARTDTLTVSVTYANRILSGEHPMDAYAKSAPKLSAFTAAIADPPNSTIAVIDRHARNAAVGERRKSRVGKREFSACSDAYNEAANLAGIAVHAMQAIVWVAWRG